MTTHATQTQAEYWAWADYITAIVAACDAKCVPLKVIDWTGVPAAFCAGIPAAEHVRNVERAAIIASRAARGADERTGE
jgi:hypothetical protein